MTFYHAPPSSFPRQTPVNDPGWYYNTPDLPPGEVTRATYTMTEKDMTAISIINVSAPIKNSDNLLNNWKHYLHKQITEKTLEPTAIAHTCDLSTWEMEVDGLGVQGHPPHHWDPVSKEIKFKK